MLLKKSTQQIETKTTTSFHLQLVVSLACLGASIMLATVSIPTYRMAGNVITGPTPLPTVPFPKSSPSPTPTPTPGCCQITCRLINGMSSNDQFPPTFTTCAQTEEKDCKNENCSAFQGLCRAGFNIASGDVYDCASVEFHKDKKCDTTKFPATCTPKTPKGCCAYRDQQNGAPQCKEGQTQQECANLGGQWDQFCQICDPVTKSCRDKLCCQLSAQGQNSCMQVDQAKDCADKGGQAKKGQCNAATGKCESTGCCEFPDPNNSSNHNLTQSDCADKGGAWEAGKKYNPQSQSCENLGCCQGGAGAALACTDSTQADCAEGNLAANPFGSFDPNAKCNYNTGACGAKNDPKLSAKITPNSHEPQNQYLHPTTGEPLTCTVRAENRQGWNIGLHVSTHNGNALIYNQQICKSGEDPCVFSVTITPDQTIAGDIIQCEIGAINPSAVNDPSALLQKSTRDSTEIQTCVYVAGQQLPMLQETAMRPKIDIVFVPDNISDQQNRVWQEETEKTTNFIMSRAPFRASKDAIRLFRNDWSKDGAGEDLHCQGGIADSSVCNFDRALQIAKICPFDKGLIVPVMAYQARAYARPRINMAVVGKGDPAGALHELAHLFKADDEYKEDKKDVSKSYHEWFNCYQEKDSSGLLSFLWGGREFSSQVKNTPCGEMNGGVFGSNPSGKGWCKGTNLNMQIPDSSPCKGLKKDSCLQVKGFCQEIITGFGLKCENYKTEQSCMREASKLCSWFKTEPICMFYNNTCIDINADYNVGNDCGPDAGCYPGCYYTAGFRSSSNSIMRHSFAPPQEFNAVTRRIIEKEIACETGTSVVCPIIQGMPDIIAE